MTSFRGLADHSGVFIRRTQTRRAMDLFGLSATVTLFDLTNTYFEGEAAKQPLARHGHSKEKRSDCP
ncbi:MAG: hypothetical protein OXQ89_18460, partial [Rhodospirillaceae bacterium]|nr:hypothetical protein [Rhodospirillaceae bacterium]